jgi:hypothetical protein
VLTSLYPFQEAQPMVRYWTGDLVHVTRSRSCRPGTTAIRPLGRSRYGVPAPHGDDWWVAPATVLEAVEDVEPIDRIPRFRDADEVLDPYVIGHPMYRLRHEARDRQTIVTLELVLRDGVRDAQEQAIEEQLRAQLLSTNTAFAGAIRDGAADLVVAFPGAVPADLIAHAE